MHLTFWDRIIFWDSNRLLTRTYFQGNKEEASSTSRPFANITLQCEKCDSTIGIEDQTVNGWRLLKAFVGLTISPSHGWESHCTDKIVAAQLLELVERESARRFIVHYGQRDGLLVCFA
jgi:hypothetical protein